MPPKGRVEALVDGIFSVAMTLLVLDIKLPDGVRLPSNADLIRHFMSVAAAFAVYVVSFLVLAMFWVAHHYQFRYVKRLDRRLLWINIGFLLLTTTVPFTANLVAKHGDLSFAVSVYAANLLLLAVALLLHDRRLLAERELATEEFTTAIGMGIRARLRSMCLVAIPRSASVLDRHGGGRYGPDRRIAGLPRHDARGSDTRGGVPRARCGRHFWRRRRAYSLVRQSASPC
jgi:uncharacterized membrane protein